VKSFARPDFHQNSLGYVRYYDFIRPKRLALLLSTFSTLGFLVFLLKHPYAWFSCSLSEPGYRSCPLNAVCRVAGKSGFRYTWSRRVALPLDFDTINVIFDTSIRVHLRSTPISIPYNHYCYNSV
jgi:hypothetical protein